MNATSPQTVVGASVLGLGALLGLGARDIASDAGYAGVGPNFLPWIVSIGLIVCGVLLLRESLSGGFRDREPVPAGEEHGHWPGFVWVSAGLLSNAALITRIGFILSCALCFMLAAQGFRSAEGKGPLSAASLLKDALIGTAIAAPVYWMFTKALAIQLPGLTATGWL